ncbi:apyrase isoform X2 [Chrysoperla carnea]|uniref:apyrase isoform X2 n=1 Tax=Chrysoperla carnea TaxID=189513 RepID=UPI001D08CCDC|nr:apyrase isoform X2 [Chrysoperla carnea]
MNTKYCIAINGTISMLICLLWIVTNSALPQNGTLFKLPIIHLNDFHARFEETTPQSTTCKPGMLNCIGGFSRLYTAVTKLQTDNPNAIFLNAGDNFQGTMWYNVHKWNATQYFFNLLPTDAYTIGNHEFDDGIDGLVPFIKSIKAPVVLANVDDSREPAIQGLYEKSTIITRENKKIGIIGVIIQEVNLISNTEKLIFLDEAESVKAEAEKLKTVDKCDIIIVLSHCGLDIDKEIAANAGPYIDVIVGGHSHTFLYHGSDLPGPDIPVDDYPVTVTQDNGHQVLIVQASCYTKYLGFITVYFDVENKLHHWEGNPIYLDQKIAQNQYVNELMVPWKEVVDQVGKQVLGETKVLLKQTDCSFGDCNIGNFIAEAMVDAWVDKAEEDEWTYAPIAILNTGGIRTGIEKGNITYADLLVAQPFENFIDAIELRGDHLLEVFEYSAATIWKTGSVYGFSKMLQTSGIHITFNATLPVGSRVQDLKLRCGKCEVPKYEPLDKTKYYRIAIVNYLIQGGDGFSMIPDNMRNHVHGSRDIDVLTKYIKKRSPIIQDQDDRMILVILHLQWTSETAKGSV